MAIVQELQQRFLPSRNEEDAREAAASFAPDAELVILLGNKVQARYKGREEIRVKHLGKRRAEKLELAVDSARFVTKDVIIADGMWREGPRQGRWTRLLRKDAAGTWQFYYLSLVLPPTDSD
jgi:hypothetical protein